MKPLKTTRLNTWSPLSSVTVRLKPSRDYKRLLILLYGFAVVALFQSALPMGLSAVFIFVLAAHGSYVWRRQTPGDHCSEVHYNKKSWLLLDDATGELVAYPKPLVYFDFGWLLWLRFKILDTSSNIPRRDVLIFQDQLTPDEHRLLRLALSVSREPKTIN